MPELIICAMLTLLIWPFPAGASIAKHQSAPKPAANNQAALVYRFVPGQRIIYRLYYNNSSAADFRVLFADHKPSDAPVQSNLASSFKTAIEGEMTATVLENRNDGAIIVYSLRKLAMNLAVSGQPYGDQAAIRHNLERNIFALVNQQGKVVSVWLDPESDETSQNFARALLAITQFVLPDPKSPAQPQWEAQEDDPNGQYIARYQSALNFDKTARRDPKSSFKIFRKTKLRYRKPERKPKPGEFDAPMTIIPKGDLMARFNAHSGQLISLDGKESQTMMIAEKTVAWSETALRLSQLKVEAATATEFSRLVSENALREKSVAATQLSATKSDETAERSIQHNALGKETSEDLLARLENIREPAGETKSTAEASDESSLYLKIKALVYVEPESSGPLGKVLATADPKSAKMRVVAGALGIVGHPQAQAALVGAIQSRLDDWPALSVLIPTLGAVGEPTQLAEDTLRDLAFNSRNEDIALTAQLSLGALARNLAFKSSERAAKIVEEIIRKIKSSKSQETTRQMLLVLGNAGSAQALPTLIPFLSAPSPSLRVAAASAMRWIDSDQVNSVLITALTSDMDASVRLEAAAALGLREIDATTFKAQKEAFLKDNSENVRLTLLSNLWKAHVSFPEARQLVKQAAASDSSEVVRNAAADIMAMYSKEYFN